MAFKDSAQQLIQRTVVGAFNAVEYARTGVAFNPLDRRYYGDPYPLYRRLREKDPLHRSRLLGGYVLTRHADVSAVLRDGRFVAETRKHPNYEKMRKRMMKSGVMTEAEFESRSMLTSDPPDHTRLRSLVTKAFTPRTIEALRPRIEEIVEQCLDAAGRNGTMDIIADLAYPLPVTVIGEMLGVPAEDREQFKRWSDEAVRVLGPASAADMRRAVAAQRQLRGYFEKIAEERRREPHEDLLSALVAVEEQGDKLTTDELHEMCLLLLVAGHETTTNLIGNGMLALLRHREQYAALRDDASLAGSAVEELLRYDSPVQATSRFAAEDFEFAGRELKCGTQMGLFLGAANRDPEVFPEPNRLDIARADNHHLSFSHGIHYCLGAPLARIEGQLAITALAQRFPDMRVATHQLEWRDNLILHGLKSLPVTLSQAQSPAR